MSDPDALITFRFGCFRLNHVYILLPHYICMLGSPCDIMQQVSWSELPQFYRDAWLSMPFACQMDAQEFMNIVISRAYYTISKLANAEPDLGWSGQLSNKLVGSISLSRSW